VDEIVRAAVDAITDRDWDTVRRLLHPYLHWILTDGQTLRGRNHVIAMLEGGDTLAAPAQVELRDGQIYRWHAAPPAR
jgi:limonene-1,2-epoxide hydrolase